MELTIKLDSEQLAMLVGIYDDKLRAQMRRHLKRHHKVIQKKLKGG